MQTQNLKNELDKKTDKGNKKKRRRRRRKKNKK